MDYYILYVGSKNVDGTSSYESDRPLVYIDDISLESKDESEITVPKPANIDEYRLFEDDFSNYGSESDYIDIADSDAIEEYECDKFILNYNACSSASNKETYPDVVASGNVERAAKVSEESGFGSKKSLIGDKSGWSGTFKSFETYTIKAGKGGSVDTIGNGVIFLKLDVGMAAQVGGKTYGAENINVSTGTTDVKFVEQSN